MCLCLFGASSDNGPVGGVVSCGRELSVPIPTLVVSHHSGNCVAWDSPVCSCQRIALVAVVIVRELGILHLRGFVLVEGWRGAERVSVCV